MSNLEIAASQKRTISLLEEKVKLLEELLIVKEQRIETLTIVNTAQEDLIRIYKQISL